MLDFPAPKTMAKALRGALADRGVSLSHGQCLDLVAKQFGFADWNVLSARNAGALPPSDLPIPSGWFSCGSFDPDQFRVGRAPDVPDASLAETIATSGVPSDAFAGLMQSFSAEAYRGKRVRLTAELTARGAGAGTIWLRVDPIDGVRPLAFDNMMDRKEDGPISGTTDWTERSVVLDVDDKAASLHFGFFLKAPGSVLARAFRIDTVDQTVPVTKGRPLPPGPVNLGFQ
ncbi:glyoxalase superfamily protein [Pelagibacterium luteolum]|uniref:Glyoxalase-related protein domain-containing protein n=1 Tax=Pelagibacterium luteolum TaxID=440168 RepID=A0A1G7Y505_9HYPH|nr:glyoxalase superfamily protein [Pelagibacterium luteolum]SDG91447.1 hypothetical protein SAMN04487974_11253 [Pelagibacterium luteolum]